MIVILITVIFALCLAIAYLAIDSYREKKIFKARIAALEIVISEITQKHIKQSDQVKISDDLNENLKKSRTVLNDTIFDLNYELFDILSKNNLLDKK